MQGPGVAVSSSVLPDRASGLKVVLNGFLLEACSLRFSLLFFYWGVFSIVRELTCQSNLQAGSFYEEMQALTALTLQEIKTHLRCNVRASEIALAWSFPVASGKTRP